MITALVFSTVIYLAVLIFTELIVSVFNSENHLGLHAVAVSGMALYFISIPFAGFNTNLAAFFTSVENALPAHILSVMRGLYLNYSRSGHTLFYSGNYGGVARLSDN